jgi:hypothetical protein
MAACYIHKSGKSKSSVEEARRGGVTLHSNTTWGGTSLTNYWERKSELIVRSWRGLSAQEMGYAMTNDTIKHLHKVEFGNHNKRHLSFCELLDDQIVKIDTPQKIE